MGWPPNALSYEARASLPRASAALQVPAAALRVPKHATIMPMPVAVFAIRLLTWMFLVGLVGSTVVVLISFVEDGKELFGKDEE